MNWYKIFYWITVADNVKKFFDVFSNIAATGFIITGIVLIGIVISYGDASSRGITEDDSKSYKYWISSVRRIFITFSILTVVLWSGYVFTPTKKDALIIVAGGAVGNFITSDSNSRQIPFEVTQLLREKIKTEIEELHVSDDVTDTRKNKTKDELIKLLQEKK